MICVSTLRNSEVYIYMLPWQPPWTKCRPPLKSIKLSLSTSVSYAIISEKVVVKRFANNSSSTCFGTSLTLFDKIRYWALIMFR